MSRDYRRGKWKGLPRFDWLSHSRNLNLMVFILSYFSVMSLPLTSSSLIGFYEWPHSQDTLDPLSILLRISSSVRPPFSLNNVVAFNSSKTRFKTEPPPPFPEINFAIPAQIVFRICHHVTASDAYSLLRTTQKMRVLPFFLKYTSFVFWF